MFKTNMLIAKTLAVAAVLVSLPSSAGARDITGIRAMGMGEALRAMPTGVEAPLLNPAGMSLAKMYVLGALYQFRASDSASQVHASIVDSVTAKLAAGVTYTYVHASPTQTLAQPGGADPYTLEEKLQTHQVALSLSMPLGSMFSIGFTGKYINTEGELPEDVPDGVTTADVSTVTVDVGGIFRLGKMLSLGVVGYNLAEVEDPAYPQTLGLGAALQVQMLLLGFDTRLDFSTADEVKPSYHGGAELFLAQKYALRAGVIHDRLHEATYFTAGLSLNARKLGLGFGLRQMVDGGAQTLFGFSLQLFMQ